MGSHSAPRRAPRNRSRRTALIGCLAVAVAGAALVNPGSASAAETATTPLALTGSVLSAGSVGLAWSAPASAGSMPIQRYDIRDATTLVTQRTTPDVRTYTWSGLTAPTVTFRVRAITGAGAGAWASVGLSLSSTVPAPTPTATATPTPTATATPAPTASATPGPTSTTAGARYVSTSGSDSNSGGVSAPYRTIARGMASLRPGDTLIVRGGMYTEDVQSPGITAGTASAPITVRAYPGERPVLVGLLWLSNASYWTLDGLNVTWSMSNSSNEHMVKMSGGTGWRITNAEIWGARSYAGILVAGNATGWRLDHLYVHDTYASNSTNQDHLVYVNSGNGGGVIERSIFARSRNGRGIKVGPPSPASTGAIGGVTIRYNTFMDNSGPSNIQLSYSASNNQIYRNIFYKSGTGNPNVTAYNLNGGGNTAWDNVGWASSGVLATSSSLRDGGGNFMVDPRFVDGINDFRPLEAAVAAYGRYAG